MLTFIQFLFYFPQNEKNKTVSKASVKPNFAINPQYEIKLYKYIVYSK